MIRYSGDVILTLQNCAYGCGRKAGDFQLKIERVQYKDIAAIRCRGCRLSATFSQKSGAKLLSLYDCINKTELLDQTPGENYRKPAYDMCYTSAECSGFDDMFPTIDECRYDAAPWKGVGLPDHGEVWALTWEMEITDSTLHFWTYSPRFAYRLDKWIRQHGNGFRIHYKVRNLCEWEFKCIYAAHCMLAARENARLELPFADGSECLTIFSDFQELGKYGDPVTWSKQNGVELDRSYPRGIAKGFKIYFKDRIPQGWCRYWYNEQTALEIAFDPMSLPYFAVWANYGAFQKKYNVAIEPCTAPMDDPFTAQKYGALTALPAYGTKEWHLDFSMVEYQR